MENLSGGTLLDRISAGRIPIPAARLYAAEIALAVGHLHMRQIIHRDLKPENVFLDDAGHCRLGDFGLVKTGMKPGSTTETFCGTPYYMSPEMVLGGGYGPGQDWWALGCILFEMAVGRPPYLASASRVNELYEAIASPDPVRMPRELRGEPTLCDFLKRILEKSEAERLGAKEGVGEIQAHPFFAGVDWDGLLARRVQMPWVPQSQGPLPADVEARPVMDGQSCQHWDGFTMAQSVAPAAIEPVRKPPAKAARRSPRKARGAASEGNEDAGKE
jgi:serine/threonine protein kinase